MSNTTGQSFLKEVTRYYGIGGQTRRFRKVRGYDQNVLEHVLTDIMQGTRCPRGTWWGETTFDALAPSYATLLTWEKHVLCGRIDGESLCILRQAKPYAVLKLIAEMVDGGVTTSGEAERWFRANRARILQMRTAHMI